MRSLITAIVMITCGLSSAISFAAEAAENAKQPTPPNPVAVITGSSSGLGYQLAKIAADKGMRLLLVDINLQPSRKLAEKIRAAGGEAYAIEVDLSLPESRGKISDAITEHFQRVDYLFNNAGYAYLAALEDQSLDQAHHLFEVNYWAYVDLAQRVIPWMKRQGSGHIINISSVLGAIPAGPDLGVYSASKHALIGMFQSAAAELKPAGIFVTTVCPAGMKTNIMASAIGPRADQYRNVGSNWPSPEGIAEQIFSSLEEAPVLLFPGDAKSMAGNIRKDL